MRMQADWRPVLMGFLGTKDILVLAYKLAPAGLNSSLMTFIGPFKVGK